MANRTVESTTFKDNYWEVILLIWRYCCPVIMTTGIIGNTLSILVYSKKNMRKNNLGTQLIILSIVDLLYILLSALPYWLKNAYEIDISAYSPIVCKVRLWLSGSASAISTWILVIITLKRLYSIFRPLDSWTQKSSKLCESLLIMVLSFCFTAINSHYLYGWGRVYYRNRNNTLVLWYYCSMYRFSDYYFFYFNHWLTLRYSLFAYIPFGVLLLSNVAILYKLTIGKDQSFLKDSTSASSKRNEQVRRNLKLIISLNVFFFISMVPMCVLLLNQRTWNRGSSAYAYKVTEVIGRMLVYTNHSANFFFYFLTKQFRNELFAMFGKRLKKQFTKSDETLTTATS